MKKPIRAKPNMKTLAPETIAVRAGTRRSSDFQEHSEAMFLTSSFCFNSAEEAEHGFSHADQGFIYSRFTNPTVSMFQDRLAALEGGEACIATSSGMSAILTTAMAHLQAGDHVICSKSVFGATTQLFSSILGRFGITTTYVAIHDVKAWQAAVQKNTRLFYLETPSNPLTEIADIAAIAKVAKKAKSLFVVDNCFCTPALQKPLELGADDVESLKECANNIRKFARNLLGQGVQARQLTGLISHLNDVLTASVVAEKAVRISSLLDINTHPPIQVVAQTRNDK